jgi:hypothetical protein
VTLRYDSRSRVSTYTQSWVSNVDPDFGAFESIATTTVGAGGAGSVIFSSIPQNYKHLQIRSFCKTNRPTYSVDEITYRINGDTGNNYSAHHVGGTGSAAESASSTSYSSIRFGSFMLSTTTVHASMFGGSIIDLLDYTSTNKYKTVRTLTGYDTNATATDYYGYITLSSGLWMNSSAVTSMTLYSLSGASFVQYSHFALYGIKG